MQLLGEQDNPVCRRLGNLIVKEDVKLLEWKAHGKHDAPAGFLLYWMYYATQAVFQRGGSDWDSWNKKFQKVLLDNQHPDGYWLSPATKGIETDRNNMIDIDNKVYYRFYLGVLETMYTGIGIELLCVMCCSVGSATSRRRRYAGI